jgi:DNA-binding NtrC family response regulator
MEQTINILSFVLDDDADILELIEGLLKENGIHNYRLFSTEKELFDNLTKDIHVCVIDHYLPSAKTGLQVCKEIKSISPDSFVIVMTGQQDTNVVIDYLNACADKYIDKNRKDHLLLLIDYLNVGLEQAKKRLDEITILQQKRERIKERRKHYDR